MNAQIKYFFLKLTILIAFFVTLSCDPNQSTGGIRTPDPNGPAAIEATYHRSTSVSISARCSTPNLEPSFEWTASSTAGSTQTETLVDESPFYSNCETVKDMEGAEHTICTCPQRMAFRSLAPGTWTISVRRKSSPGFGGTACSTVARGGQTTVLHMYDDFRGCQTL
jgi:hypothetical protein